ncbi:HAMP domain-containing sensor histidine kinase [Azorhizobium caulinodans]|uniref:sensor histidine kinase n=1 Tax=Azorhizobium caulinodans TaxID=7 RepID=UPI002FBEEDE8
MKRFLPGSIAASGALFLGFCLTVVLLFSWVTFAALQGDDGGYAQFDAATAIQKSLKRTETGSFTLQPVEDLLAYQRKFPTLWYLVSDGRTSVSYGPVPERVQAGAKVWSPPQPLSGYAVNGSTMRTERLGLVVPLEDDTILIEVGGAAYSSTQITIELLRDINTTAVPILVVLFATMVVTVILVPQVIARPVRRVATAAEFIDGTREGTRLPEDNAPTELRPLIAAFNRALDRIDNVTAEQRRFLSNAAHELRTPLARARTRLEAVPDPRLRAELATEIHSLSATVTMLLQLARLTSEPAEISRLNLTDLTRNLTAQEAPSLVAAGMEVEFQAPDTPVFINGSAQAITVALSNLIRNAAQHAASGGRVIVQVEACGRVSVIDFGAGIGTIYNGSSVMQPFARSSQSSSGTGLGLSIVAQVAALHNAGVSLDETPGGGTTVRIAFTPLPVA